VASEGHVDNVIKATVSEFGTVDILVVNAGITAEGLLHEFTLADWNYVLSINLTGAFISIKTVLPYMISKGKGCIVGVSSISADLIAVGRGSAVYEVSKAGLSQLLRAVAVEYADRGIRANTVCPGRVSTQLGEHRRELEATHFASRPTEFRRIFKSSPANRSADPTEIAKAIAFLASDDASFITGADLRIDGGYSLV
jgi:3-oxoacyl-[acyl-carrier protein] reductase